MTREEKILSLEKVIKTNIARLGHAFTRAIGREDLTNCAWVAAIRCVDKFDETVSPGTDLAAYANYAIRGALLDYLRYLDPLTKEHRRDIKAGKVKAPVTVSIDAMVRPVKDRRPQFNTDEIDVGKLLYNAGLTAKQRECVVARHIEERTLPDIAKRRRISLNTVNFHIRSGMKKMRSYACSTY